jgi:hypothetical protein
MLTGLGGCIYVTSNQPDKLSREPLLVDEAMLQRDWEPVTVAYPSGAVVAGSPRVPFTGPRVYRGSHFPPTQTAQPPLPDEPEPEEPGLLERLIYKDTEVIPAPPAEDPGPPPAPGEEPATPLVPPATQPQEQQRADQRNQPSAPATQPAR